MDLDESTVGVILQAPKALTTVPSFEPKGAYFKARGEVANSVGFDLALEVTWSPKTGKASLCLFARRVKPGWSRLYGIDLGDDHHNPDCNNTGDPHRHNRWSVTYGDRFGSGAPDLKGKSVPEAFDIFVSECNISVRGALTMPSVQGTLF